MVRSVADRTFQPWALPLGDGLADPARTPRLARVLRHLKAGLIQIREQRATGSFGSLHIGIPLQVCQNSEKKFSQLLKHSENSKTSQHFLECSAKSGEKIINILPKFDEIYLKITILGRNSNRNSKTFGKFLRMF